MTFSHIKGYKKINSFNTADFSLNDDLINLKSNSYVVLKELKDLKVFKIHKTEFEKNHPKIGMKIHVFGTKS